MEGVTEIKVWLEEGGRRWLAQARIAHRWEEQRYHQVLGQLDPVKHPRESLRYIDAEGEAWVAKRVTYRAKTQAQARAKAEAAVDAFLEHQRYERYVATRGWRRYP